MEWSTLPSLNSMRSFAALAEAGSYKHAAVALNVTHAAVSQQIRALEDRLGMSLVTPQGRGVRLTRDGLELARELSRGFSILQSGVEKISSSGATHSVQLTTSPAFAMEWLMPKIQDFQSTFPDIPLLVNPTSKLVNLDPDGVEVAVRYRDKRKFGEQAGLVLISDMVVIAAPGLVKNRDLNKPEHLLALPWLQELNTNEVTDWFGSRDVNDTQLLKVTNMPGNLIMQAVRRGDGVTYTARAFFEEEIQNGRMTVLFSDSAVGQYCIETCRGPLRQSAQTLVDWLLSKSETCVI